MFTAKIKLAIMGALVVALGVAMWQWRAEIRNAAQWAVGFSALEQTIRDMETQAQRDRRTAAARDSLTKELRQELERLRQVSEEREERIRELLERDEEYRDWAGQRLPAGVTGRVPVAGPDGSDAHR